MQPDVVTSGCVGEWHAARAHLGVSQGHNQGAETQLFDTSGNANHGTLTTFGFTTASGYAGTGTLADPYRLVFDGTSDYVTVADSAALRPGLGDYSVEVWFDSPFTESAAWPGLLGKGIATVAPVGVFGLVGSSALLDRLRFQDVYAAGAWNANLFATGTLAAGRHHVVVSRISGTYQPYVDGVAYGAPITPANVANLNSTAALQIGCSADPRYMGTGIYAARYYCGHGLSLAEVQQNYAAGYLWPPDWVRGGPALSSRRILKVDGFDVPVVA